MDPKRRSLEVLGCIFVLQLCLASVFVSANLVFQVEHKFHGRERSLSALKSHDSHRHGRMLAVADLPLSGNGSPTDSALYYTKIGIGTPSHDYHVQVDTGSDILWVNCAGCDSCPKKTELDIKLAQYNPKASTTAKTVTCDQDFCATVFNGPSSSCTAGTACQYSVTYGDGSSSDGFFVTDYVHFDRVSGDLQTTSMNGSVSFGCGAKQSGDFNSSAAALDGIVGFGQANSSMISQLALSGKVKKVFSHCLESTKGGGIFAIGQLVEPKLKSTPLVPNESHYNVMLKAIEVAGDALQLPTDLFGTGASRQAIIDSGSTLAYLPDEVYNQLMKKILGRQPNMKTHLVDEQFKCFYYSGNVDDGFPIVTFHFANSLSLRAYPHEYLFLIDNDDQWCIGWQNSASLGKDGHDLTLLGDIVLSNKLVLYDLENETIGWTEYNCSSSIKVKDEQSGQVYLLGAHTPSSSSASSPSTGMILTFLLLIATHCNLI